MASHQFVRFCCQMKFGIKAVENQKNPKSTFWFSEIWKFRIAGRGLWNGMNLLGGGGKAAPVSEENWKRSERFKGAWGRKWPLLKPSRMGLWSIFSEDCMFTGGWWVSDRLVLTVADKWQRYRSNVWEEASRGEDDRRETTNHDGLPDGQRTSSEQLKMAAHATGKLLQVETVDLEKRD